MNELIEGQKKASGSKLPIPYSKSIKKEIVRLQGEYQIKYKRKITVVDLCAAIFNEGLKTYRI